MADCDSCRNNRTTLEANEGNKAKEAKEAKEANQIIICVDPKKEDTLKDLILENVCALRNAGGGQLYIHVKTQDRKNEYHGWLDRIIDDKLLIMIEDGSMFTDAYSKKWVTDKNNKDDIKGDHTLVKGGHKGYLCIDVSGATQFCSVDMHTSVQTDQSVIYPSAYSICRFLGKRKTLKAATPPKGHTVRECYESRNVQFKGLFGIKPKKTVEKLFSNLKKRNLEFYVSAFAKQEAGGHFYFGVNEDINENDQTVADIKATGFQLISDDAENPKQKCQDVPEDQPTQNVPSERYAELTDPNNIDMPLYNKFINLINEYLDARLCVYDYDGVKMEIIPSKDLYKARYYDADSKGCFFLEIAVSPVEGLVFTDLEGPKSFIWRFKRVDRFKPKDWIDKLKKTLRKPDSHSHSHSHSDSDSDSDEDEDEDEDED